MRRTGPRELVYTFFKVSIAFELKNLIKDPRKKQEFAKIIEDNLKKAIL
ncbi:MAG: hypothetical protein N2654_03255 [Deltaproteobacteria bacterium]|nr:hypothetical protein [Deltaproteobacteria bacterium]